MAAAVTYPMYEPDLISTIFTLVFALIAMSCTGVGCNVLIRRKPLILSSGWSMSVPMLLLAPAMANSIATFVERIKENAVSFRDISMVLFAGMADVWFELIFFLIFSVFCVFLLISTREYTFIGVNEEAIRGAIYYGLQKLEISCKDTRAWIKLPELNARLRISTRSWASEGEIEIKDRSQKAFLKKLVKQMRIYFREQNIPTKKVAAIEYLVIGIVCMAFALSEILPTGWMGIF